MTFASRMQHKIYWGPLRKPIEWSLKTVLAPWAYIASVVYHDSFWYPLNAERRMTRGAALSPGDVSSRTGRRSRPTPTASPTWATPRPRRRASGCRALGQSVGILGTCIKEAPEFASRRRHQTHGPEA